MIDHPVVFPMGRETLGWIRDGGPPERRSFALYRWHALWFERNLRTVASLIPSNETLAAPVFVLGVWRSGTTFLHNLLSCNGGLLAPTTWQCMNSALHALHAAPADDRAMVRPMDGFTVRADSPQEDEFALLAQGVPSAYRVFFDPRRIGEVEAWLDPDVWDRMPAERWAPCWKRFLASVAAGRRGRLLLKSPGHTFRFPAIHREFPESRYVWLLRDPADTLRSNVKMWMAMVQRYSLWRWRDEELRVRLEAFVRLSMERACQALEDARRRLDRGQLAVVHFDELTARPSEVLARIHGQLGLDWGGVRHELVEREIGAVRPSAAVVGGAAGAEFRGLGERYAAALASHGI